MSKPNLTKRPTEGRTLGVELANGRTIALPITAWRDQPLVRSLIHHATGKTTPQFTDDEWDAIVRAAFVAAEEIAPPP